MANKKKLKVKVPKPKMVKMASLPFDFWVGQYIVASMMVKAYEKHGKVPTAIGVAEDCLKEQPDGSGKLEFYAEF